MEDALAIPEVRVLVVDDNVDVATSLGYLLQLMGAKTAVAFGGDMALRLMRLFQPMLVLIDLRMPGLDGCEVMREARALPGVESGTLFVCFSASRDEADRQRCVERFRGLGHQAVDAANPRASWGPRRSGRGASPASGQGAQGVGQPMHRRGAGTSAGLQLFQQAARGGRQRARQGFAQRGLGAAFLGLAVLQDGLVVERCEPAADGHPATPHRPRGAAAVLRRGAQVQHVRAQAVGRVAVGVGTGDQRAAQRRGARVLGPHAAAEFAVLAGLDQRVQAVERVEDGDQDSSSHWGAACWPGR